MIKSEEKINTGFSINNRKKVLNDFQNFDIAYDRSFALVAYIANRFLVDHMLRSARFFANNDYETVVIWGVLAHQNIAHLLPPGTLSKSILSPRGRIEDEKNLKPLLLRDVAAITGIPRETTRRKLELLAKNGFARRTPKGWIVVGDRVESDLREFTKDTIIRLISVYEDINNVLKKSDAAIFQKTYL